MKTTVKCDQPGCDYTNQVNPKYAAQTLGRHKLFAHGIKGKSASAKHRYKVRKSEVAPVGAEEQPKKRAYTKKQNDLSVSLCPVCGCNIHAVNVAINLRR